MDKKIKEKTYNNLSNLEKKCTQCNNYIYYDEEFIYSCNRKRHLLCHKSCFEKLLKGVNR